MREKIIGAAGSASGIASVLGSWQICHSVCIALIALLGMIGVTLTGMPLAFLTKLAIPLWSIAVVLLVVIIYLYFKHKCIRKELVIINLGLILAGTPFVQSGNLRWIFWSVGAAIVLWGIIQYVRRRKNEKCCD